MISVQPVFSLHYFKLSKNNLPKGVKKLFYLSWEDALWDLLKQKRIMKKSYILLPDFFCGDVEKNIRSHGYRIVKYSVGPNLISSETSFLQRVKKYQPKVVVIFHPVGIYNNLLNKKFVKRLPKETILIEDSVHRVVDPSRIKIIKKNHFVIDSLRKVLPLQGSCLYGRVEDLDFNSPLMTQSLWYSIKVHTLWFAMVVLWQLGLSKSAEKVMLLGYDLIGDSDSPAAGIPLLEFLNNHINIELIKKTKINQTEFYENNLKKLPILYQKDDSGNLRGWPVILNTNANKILDKLRGSGITLRFELNDSIWSQKQKIIYLPMGLHISEKTQDKICKVVNESLSCVV